MRFPPVTQWKELMNGYIKILTPYIQKSHFWIISCKSLIYKAFELSRRIIQQLSDHLTHEIH